MPRVIDIQRRHMELGRIRLGEKGSKGQPQRLDTWRLTSASRSLMDSAAAAYGGTVEEWTDAPDKGYWQLTTDTDTLDVIVPPGDPYTQFYELWSGGGCKRRCTGEIELLSDTACKCDPEERECKITTRINVMLPRVAGLGVWRLESHGYYAAAELPDALDLLQQISGGRMVSGLLRIEQRSSKKDGRTNRYPVPVLDLPNVTLASLVGNQVVVNPPPALERGKPPMLNGGSLPEETQFRDNETPAFGERPALPTFDAPAASDGQPQAGQAEEPPAQRAGVQAGVAGSHPAASSAFTTRGQVQEAIARAAHDRGMRIADVDKEAKALGIARGQASIDDLTRLLAAITSERAGVPTEPAPSTPSPGDSIPPGTATVPGSDGQALSPAQPSESGPAPSLDDVLAASGGELIPPKPGTKAYRDLPSGTERANAKAYWDARKDAEPEQESLAEALGAPAR